MWGYDAVVVVHVVVNVNVSVNAEIHEVNVVGDVLDVVACAECCQETEVKNVEGELGATVASMGEVKMMTVAQLRMVELLNEQEYWLEQQQEL